MEEVVAYFIKTNLDITRNFRFKLAAYERFLLRVDGRVLNELTIGRKLQSRLSLKRGTKRCKGV